MYLEFIYLIADYFKTVRTRTFLYEFLIPIVVGVFVYYLLCCEGSKPSTEIFTSNLIRLMSVLVGFSITIITILTTGGGKNIQNMKSQILDDYKLGKNKISLHTYLLINFAYSVVVEILIVIFSLIYPIVLDKINIGNQFKYIGFSILVTIALHLLLLNVRNITDFYMTISKQP